NKETGKRRIALQIKLSDELDKLRILLRLTKDLRFMSIKQYAHGAQLLNEIGRILTGWMRVRVEEKSTVAKQDLTMTLF
ncbi:MAG: four helix bundle protein, partial [Candidatus Roizmanbacteria bacterium]|nr:four helix bundle protein [Candidatus Roizmanbacteria bacterium]